MTICLPVIVHLDDEHWLRIVCVPCFIKNTKATINTISAAKINSATIIVSNTIMKGAAPNRISALRERRMAATGATVAATPQKVRIFEDSSSVAKQTPASAAGACAAYDDENEEIQIHMSVTTTHMRYSGMLDIQHMMCTCGTAVGVHPIFENMSVQEYQEIICSKRPCCVRFMKLGRRTFCSNFDVKIGPQGQEAATTRKTIKIAAAVRRPIDPNAPVRVWEDKKVTVPEGIQVTRKVKE